MEQITKEELLERIFHSDYEDLKGKRLRMTRVRVPGREVCLAHIISPSQSCIYQNLALHIGVHEGEDHRGESIVPGREVCLAHIISPSQSCIYQNLALHIGVHEGEDHRGESIGLIRFTPWEAVVVAADIAVKSAHVEIGQNLALHIGVHEGEDHRGESIGLIRFTPWEAVVVAADIAVKSAHVEIGFMDRFCGSLILTGGLSQVETAVKEVVRFFDEELNFPTCVKSAHVEIGFMDRFCGSLILTGGLSQVETAVKEVVRFFDEELNFPTCEIHRN